MKPTGYVALATFFVSAALIFAGASSPANAAGLEILPVGSLARSLDAESSTTYQWLLYNGLNNTFILRISVDEASGPGWDSELQPQVVIFAPGETLLVNLTIHAGGDVSRGYANQTVVFNFNDTLVPSFNFARSSAVSSKLVPFWSSVQAGKNKLLGQFDNPLPAPFNGNYATFALSIALWAGIAAVFAYVIGPMARVFTKRTKTDLDDRVIGILHVPIFALIIVFGVVDSFAILPLTSVETGVLYRIYIVALIAVITFVGYKVYKEIIIYLGRKWASRTRTEIDDVLIPVLDKVGGLLILIFGALAVLTYFGYNITFLLAGVGVLGLVIAFAAQDALSNFFSGMALLLDRPFMEGDYVQLTSGEICKVEKIGLRSCRLYDVFQNNRLVLPNNKLTNDKIVNLSEPDGKGVVEVAVNVVHGSDIAKIERIMGEAAADNKDVLKGTSYQPSVRFTSFGESALEFKLFAWVEDFMSKWRVAHELRKEIDRRFSEAGIRIAVPERTVHLREEKG